jgi:hypothetical protein
VASIRGTVQRARWNPALHPRGRDGRFIESGGLVNLFDGAGFAKPSGRGRAVGVRQDESGEELIQVQLLDPPPGDYTRGDIVEIDPENAEAAPEAKARISDEDLGTGIRWLPIHQSTLDMLDESMDNVETRRRIQQLHRENGNLRSRQVADIIAEEQTEEIAETVPEEEVTEPSVTPRQVYHVTSPEGRAGIEKTGFRSTGENGAFFGQGIYFHTDKSHSDQYLENWQDEVDPRAEQMKAVAEVRNPFIVHTEFQEEDFDRDELAETPRPLEKMWETMRDAGLIDNGARPTPSEITRILQDAGYDAVEVIHHGEYDNDSTGSQLVLFDPERAKAVLRDRVHGGG